MARPKPPESHEYYGPLAALATVVTHPERPFKIRELSVHYADPNDPKDTEHSVSAVITFEPIDYAQFHRRKGAPNPLIGSRQLNELLSNMASIIASTHPPEEAVTNWLDAKEALDQNAMRDANHEYIFPHGINASHQHGDVTHTVQIVPGTGEARLVISWPRAETPTPGKARAFLIRAGVLKPRKLPTGFEKLSEIVETARRNNALSEGAVILGYAGRRLGPNFRGRLR